MKKLFLYAEHLYRSLFRGYCFKFSREWDSLLCNILDDYTEINLYSSRVITITTKDKKYEIGLNSEYFIYGELMFVSDSNGRHSSQLSRYRPRFKTMLKLDKLVKKTRKDIANKNKERDRQLKMVNGLL